MKTGMIQNSPRLFRRLAETRDEWERFIPRLQTQPRPGHVPKPEILQRIAWDKVLDFVVGFGVLAGGIALLLYGIPIVAAVLGVE